MTGGRTRDAEKLFERALAVRERAVGPDHPDTARSMNNLAAFYAGTGYPEKALPLALRLIASGRGELRAVLPVLADAERNQLIQAEPAVDAMLACDPARRPVVGRIGREQAGGAAGRGKRSPRRTGSPRSGPCR